MKKLLAVSFCGLILAGCGDSIPSECATTLKEYDNLIAEMSKQDNMPAAVKDQLKTARDSLEKGIKEMNKDQAVQACKTANASFEQMKQMLPK